MEADNMSHGFTITGDNNEFCNKSKEVFGALDSIQSNLVPIKNDDSLKNKNEDNLSEDEGVCCSPPKISKIQEKSFRKRQSKVPNYVTNPDKWVKYDLRDTELQSNKSNSQIAFSFLKEKQRLKETSHEKDSESNSSNEHKHTFKLPSSNKPQDAKMSKNIIDKNFDKVELDHLDENVSVTEYEQSIVAKLEEEIIKSNEEKPKSTSISTSAFKSRPKINRRNLRKNVQDSFSDELL